MTRPDENTLIEGARAALVHWGGIPQSVSLVSARENVVFSARLTSGRRVALRLHRPGYQSPAAIEAELMWTERLEADGFPVPAPVRTTGGALTTPAGDRLASVVGWLDGVPVTNALGGPGRRGLFFRTGALLARFHGATDRAMGRTPIARPAWDEEGLFGEGALWGRFWESPVFLPTDRALVDEVRAAARAHLRTLRQEGADFGLIHADVLSENVLETGAGLALIDFDDSGYGFRLYDLGTALFQSALEPDLADCAKALCDGYDTARSAKVRPADILPFLLFRTLASCGWIASRSDEGDQRRAFYRKRALHLARGFLSAP